MMKKIIVLSILLASFSILKAQKLISKEEKQFHKEVLKDKRWDENTLSLLESFSANMINYNIETFINQFSSEFVEYVTKRDLEYVSSLEKAIWYRMAVPSSDRDNYFQTEVKDINQLEKWDSIDSFYFVGIETFGKDGFRLFFKLVKGEEVYAGRVFLHTSGPENTLELHGPYG